MAAQAERSTHSLPLMWFRERLLIALYGCLSVVSVAIGVLGLLESSSLRQMLDSWIEIHALFGLMLCSLLFARCRWRVKYSPRMSPADIRGLSCQLSRIVYVFIFAVIGVRQSIAIFSGLMHGTAVDFNLFDSRFRHGPDGAHWNPKDDFQLFLTAGFCLLILVRVSTFRLWLRAVESGSRTFSD